MSYNPTSSDNPIDEQSQPQTDDHSGTEAQLLDVVAMPLKGRHLIEASAGTGKTFNITRLYLRLLLEKKLTVKEILVMTFTKAATEEIKGRIAATLREALLIWQQAKDNGNEIDSGCDPVYQYLFNSCDIDESLALLKAAQLELDEASVFTIHGFCQHVITQLAFNSGFAMSLNLGNDTSDLYLEAAEDFIRKISKSEDEFRLLAESGWHTPEKLLREFNASIKSTLTPILLSEEDIEAACKKQLDEAPHTSLAYVKSLLQSVEDNEGLLVEQLIKTPAHKKERPQELAALKAWLRSCVDEQSYYLPPPEAEAFVKGNRYARNSSGVKEILTPIKDFAGALKKAFGEKDKALSKVPVFKLVVEAIAFIKSRVEKQKKQLGVIDFDDLIRMLADEVVKPNNTLVPELRKKFPVALIDEFQDTDAKQYAILDAVYPNPENANESALLMIGDPKQAIYRFRGGDIFTYLKAGRQADYRWVMNTNWRSVEGMVKAYNRLFYGAPVASNRPADVFGFDIKYNPVEFTPKAAAAKTPLIDPAEQDKVMKSAVMKSGVMKSAVTKRSAMNYVSMCLDDKENAHIMRRKMAQWIAQEIYRLLNEAHFQTANGGTAPVKPQDIAILVKDRTEAGAIKSVLQQKGLACVYLSDRSNLFASAEAKDVLRLLNGIWHANDTSKVASSLASPLWGYSAQTLIELLYHEDDAQWDAAIDKVLSLRDMWLQKGCMSVLLYLMQDSYQPHADSVERALTNYQHLAEVLEKASTTHQRPEQLLDWLNKQIHKPESDEELTLRLESDSQLIRLITQHGSKGLEYPIVFVPFATGYRDAAKNGNTTSQIFTYYDEEKQDLQMQLGQTPQAIARVQSESEAEDMRLAYVAVTRAAHRCYMGVVPLTNNERSALARALGVGGDGSNNDWSSVLNRVADEDASHASHIDGDEFEEVYNGFEQEDELPQLTALQFTGTASEEWRLYSFSAMSRLTTVGANQSVETGTAAESGATTEPLSQTLPSVPVLQTIRDEEVYARDTLVGEMGSIDADINSSAGIESTVSKSDLRFTLEKGASAGNLLHDILEHSDFSAPDWEETGKELVNRFGLDEKRTPLLYEWLEEALQTPLYPNMQLSMSDLPLAQTLREAEFYFPMNDTQWTQLREVLATHRKNVADVIGGEMETAPQLITAKLQGMMHGFIDLIFEHDGQFYVADYKSTWLGDTLDSYTPTALFHNSQHHLYDLQYLIYCLALHRYLKNTLPNYDPDMHFGGVYYLYLRGMHPENERGEGVFYTDVPSSVLNRLDGIFASKDDAQQGNSSSNAGSSHQPLEQTSSGQQQFSFDDE